MTCGGEMMNEPAGPVIDDELVDCLMAQVDAEGLDLLGPDGVLTELTSRILSRGLEVEMTDHLGYEKGDRAGWGSGNNRNGSYEPTVPKPGDLSPLASRWWDHVVPQLVRQGLGQSVDLHSLVILGEDYAEWDRASRLYWSAPPIVMRGSSKVPVLDEQGRRIWDGEGDERRQRVELPDRDFEDLDRGFDEWQAALRLQEERQASGETT